jgi:hypothetical protein
VFYDNLGKRFGFPFSFLSWESNDSYILSFHVSPKRRRYLGNLWLDIFPKRYSSLAACPTPRLSDKQGLLWIYLMDEILAILIFLFSLRLLFFLHGFLRFFLGHLFVLLLTFSHDFFLLLNTR